MYKPYPKGILWRVSSFWLSHPEGTCKLFSFLKPNCCVPCQTPKTMKQEDVEPSHELPGKQRQKSKSIDLGIVSSYTHHLPIKLNDSIQPTPEDRALVAEYESRLQNREPTVVWTPEEGQLARALYRINASAPDRYQLVTSELNRLTGKNFSIEQVHNKIKHGKRDEARMMKSGAVN